tara:strand:+ start:349 stop:564 length:216 start_codon:yes stop_codon:yes gene_type:complete
MLQKNDLENLIPAEAPVSGSIEESIATVAMTALAQLEQARFSPSGINSDFSQSIMSAVLHLAEIARKEDVA